MNTEYSQLVNCILRNVLAILLIQTGSQAMAATLDLAVIRTEVYNDRIGNSRFFSDPNTDKIRISSFVTPSLDTDASLVSDNGGATSLSFTHSTFSGSYQSMTYIGPKSPRGGGANEFTYSTPYASSNPNVLPNVFAAANLANFDATPFSIRAINPLSSNSPLFYTAPDYDMNAMPEFVTDMKLTAGLTPTIEWKLPTSGTTPTNVSIQFRKINAESGNRITDATLIQVVSLSANATSYTVPVGLLVDGSKYEISVQLDVRSGSELKGRSRSFFEFTPLPAGNGQVAVFLPSAGTDGKFKFDVAVTAGQQIALDPIVAVGYDYQVGAGDPLFASVLLPDIGDGLFDLYLFDGNDWLFQSVLAAGQQYIFGGSGVDRFRILGIETSAGLDPTDVTAFITTLTFASDGRFTGTMTPITMEIPEPSAIFLLALSLFALTVLRKQSV